MKGTSTSAVIADEREATQNQVPRRIFNEIAERKEENKAPKKFPAKTAGGEMN